MGGGAGGKTCYRVRHVAPCLSVARAALTKVLANSAVNPATFRVTAPTSLVAPAPALAVAAVATAAARRATCVSLHWLSSVPTHPRLTCHLFQLLVAQTCGGVGHLSRECTSAQKCFNCGQGGHISRDCPHPQNKSCYNCGESGHVRQLRPLTLSA